MLTGQTLQRDVIDDGDSDSLQPWNKVPRPPARVQMLHRNGELLEPRLI